MSVVISINTSGWSVIIFWFFVSILIGTLGIYLGPKFRNIIKSDKGPNIKYYDIFVIVITIWLITNDMIFWFVQDHYDGFTLETAYISASVYGDIGLALIYYPLVVICNKFVNRIRKIWRVKKDDVD